MHSVYDQKDIPVAIVLDVNSSPANLRKPFFSRSRNKDEADGRNARNSTLIREWIKFFTPHAVAEQKCNCNISLEYGLVEYLRAMRLKKECNSS